MATDYLHVARRSLSLRLTPFYTTYYCLAYFLAPFLVPFLALLLATILVPFFALLPGSLLGFSQDHSLTTISPNSLSGVYADTPCLRLPLAHSKSPPTSVFASLPDSPSSTSLSLFQRSLLLAPCSLLLAPCSLLLAPCIQCLLPLNTAEAI